MDPLGDLLAELFPGLHLTGAHYSIRAGNSPGELTLELLTEDNRILRNPEACLLPAVRKALDAHRSANELRKDDHDET